MDNTEFQSVLKKKIFESLDKYNQLMNYMSADLPIESLCISKRAINLLRKRRIFRVYDLFDLDLTKIEGLHADDIRDLTAGLNQFLPIR